MTTLRKDWLKLLKSAKKRGWVEDRLSSNNHLVLLWPVTGRKVTLSGSSDVRAVMNAEKQLRRMEQEGKE